MATNRYEIMREFVDGLLAAMRPSGIDDTKSAHWLAGYEAGYSLRGVKNQLLDEYLVSIGERPQDTIRIASGPAAPVKSPDEEQNWGKPS